MRYIIDYVVSKTAWATATTTCAVLADSEENALKAFRQDHDSEIVSVKAADEGDRLMCGLGWYTDTEREKLMEGVHKRSEERKTAAEKAMEEARTLSADEFAAYTDYITRRESEQAMNAEGIHVGDILCYTWGYDMTNWTYYQVVDTKGRHTIILRENQTKSFDYDCGQGYVRPVRDHFDGDETYTVKTSLIDGWNGVKTVRMKAPGCNHSLDPITDALGIHEYNHID